MSYDIGDRVKLTGTFTDDDGDLADPTAVTCRIKTPTGSITAYTGGQLTHDSTGVWSIQTTFTEWGTWWYRFEGTGALTAAGERPLQVQQSSF